MKVMVENIWDDSLVSEKCAKTKRIKLNEHQLDELREHIDLISFNIGKVYRHAKDRSRKEYNNAKQTVRRKLHHTYKTKKSGFKV